MKIITTFSLLLITYYVQAQSPVGNWKLTSSIIEFNGEKTDMHKALLTLRPCAEKIVYEINENGNFRLVAKNSGCDEKYISTQEKLYSQTKWKVENGHILISSTNFAVARKYKLTIEKNIMTWVGTDGEGTSIYKKI